MAKSNRKSKKDLDFSQKSNQSSDFEDDEDSGSDSYSTSVESSDEILDESDLDSDRSCDERPTRSRRPTRKPRLGRTETLNKSNNRETKSDESSDDDKDNDKPLKHIKPTNVQGFWAVAVKKEEALLKIKKELSLSNVKEEISSPKPSTSGIKSESSFSFNRKPKKLIKKEKFVWDKSDSDTEDEKLFKDEKLPIKKEEKLFQIKSEGCKKESPSSDSDVENVKPMLKKRRLISSEDDSAWNDVKPKTNLTCVDSIDCDSEVELVEFDPVGGSQSLFEFDRPAHVHGENLLQEYEEQKALTVLKLTEIQETLNSRPEPTELVEPPSKLKLPLKLHQQQGLKFMIWRETRTNPGGIIADEMGLGKTGLTIALIVAQLDKVERKASRYERKHKGGTLVVTPASLIHQWGSEIEKFCKKKTLSVYQFHGSDREKRAAKIAAYDVVITSYALVGLGLESQSPLFLVKWDRIILDEGHIIRNYSSLQARGCFGLSATNRWVLSGTPIQNKELDLFSLIKFLRFSPFDELMVWRRFVAASQERLKSLLESIMLRRTKKQLEDAGTMEKLPTKEIIEMRISLSDEEQTIHNFFMSFSRAVFSRFLQQRLEKHPELRTLFDNIGKKDTVNNLHRKFRAIFGTSVIQQHHILVLLLRLRQMTCHPGLILNQLPEEHHLDEFSDDEGNDDALSVSKTDKLKLHTFDLMSELTKIMQTDDGAQDLNDSDPNSQPLKFLSRNNPVFDTSRASSKMIQLLPLLEEKLQKKEKVIVVSTFVGFLNIIANALKNRNIAFCMFTGKTSMPNRGIIVDEFNNPKNEMKVMLLSMLAGGVGLNLTGANNMFIMDLYWNPQQELQTMDRIHRIGQIKSVTIVKFVCIDSIEEHILQIQEKKVQIAKSTLEGEKQFSNKLTIEDMKQLFGM